MHNMLKSLTLLALLTTACAPPKRSLCFNPDPASGVCRDAELQQAEKNKAKAKREKRTRRLAEIRRNLQLARTQLSEKKEEIATASNNVTATRLSREHDALVDTINGYLMEALLDFDEDFGAAPDKIGEHEQPITLHLKHDEKTKALLPILGGLDEADDVQVNYLSMQHKFPTAENDQQAVHNSLNEDMSVSLPPTLHIPLQLQFVLDKIIYCGTIVIGAKNNTGGEVDIKIAPEEGC